MTHFHSLIFIHLHVLHLLIFIYLLFPLFCYSLFIISFILLFIIYYILSIIYIYQVLMKKWKLWNEWGRDLCMMASDTTLIWERTASVRWVTRALRSVTWLRRLAAPSGDKFKTIVSHSCVTAIRSDCLSEAFFITPCCPVADSGIHYLTFFKNVFMNFEIPSVATAGSPDYPPSTRSAAANPARNPQHPASRWCSPSRTQKNY